MMPRYPIAPFLLGLIAATLLVTCQQAYSADRIGVHIASQHSEKGFNNVNPGVYVVHSGYTIGTYYNSEYRQSYYAGYTFEGKLSGPINYGITVGAITGYAAGKVTPMVVPSISYNDGLFGGSTRLSFVPKIQRNGAHAVHLSYEWSF